VAFGGFLLLGGRASDLFGPRRMFVIGLVLYAVASLAGGMAHAPWPLVAARAVQGLGGALLFPATLMLISTGFAPGRERNRAFAVWGTAGGGGMILGSLLGGMLTEAFGWTAVFFVNVPLAGVAALAALPLIPGQRRPEGTTRRRFDVAGALTGTAGTTLLVVALVQGPESGWASAPVVGAAVAGMLLLAAFVTIERRGSRPLLPLGLLRGRDLGSGALVTFLYMGTFGSLLYFLTVYFQAVLGYGALRTGLAFWSRWPRSLRDPSWPGTSRPCAAYEPPWSAPCSWGWSGRSSSRRPWPSDRPTSPSSRGCWSSGSARARVTP
jgi:MFS family permease